MDARHEPLIPKHGGYRKLKSFLVTELVYDVTVRFCDRFIDRRSRTHDQMVQAARSGVQNIAEGSQASGTSRKMEIKLTNVARASLEELRRDYEDYQRQHKFPQWGYDDPRRAALIAQRCATADDVARWVRLKLKEDVASTQSTSSNSSTPDAMAANAILVLLAAACSLLDRQIAAQASAFEREGGFTERLYRVRNVVRTRMEG